MRPAFRYSPSRGAYVLRIIGGHWGPVLRAGQASASAKRLSAEE